MNDSKLRLLANIKGFFRDRSPGSDGDGNDHIVYGTAGFRGRADKIEHIFYKVGLVAGLRCLVKDANVGVMITASHNPIQDNGVKLIDSNGEMLAADWEPIVEHFCNLKNEPELIYDELMRLSENFQIDLTRIKKYNIPHVLIGFDTRPSCGHLVELVLSGLRMYSPLIEVDNYGQSTTPALHYLVAESNKRNKRVDLNAYYNKLIDGLADLFDNSKSSRNYYNPSELIVDCANGVGVRTLEYMCNNEKFIKKLPIKLINKGDGILNHQCGADYVKTKLQPPIGATETLVRYAALDGDADRIIYFYLELEKGIQKLKLLDGDKIMALYALYLKDAVKRANLEDVLSLGIVQTAYANGASTDYLKQQLGLSVDCVDTGVKNLHRKALEYDIAIYFEANGHGTIWISDKARKAIDGADSDAGLEVKRLLKILNNYTGDAISDALIVEAILNHYDMNIESWYKFYEDRPNSLIKVEVKDRNVVKTTNAGQICLEPVGLQEEIDSLVHKFSPQARSFVRASGTEDVVRIYAEARTQENAEKLAQLVGQKVIQMCNA